MLRLRALVPLFIHICGVWSSCVGHCQELDGIDEGSSRRFAWIPGPLQTVEYWGVILPLQAFSGFRVDIDHLDVPHGVAMISDQETQNTPVPLSKKEIFFSGR